MSSPLLTSGPLAHKTTHQWPIWWPFANSVPSIDSTIGMAALGARSTRSRAPICCPSSSLGSEILGPESGFKAAGMLVPIGAKPRDTSFPRWSSGLVTGTKVVVSQGRDPSGTRIPSSVHHLTRTLTSFCGPQLSSPSRSRYHSTFRKTRSLGKIGARPESSSLGMGVVLQTKIVLHSGAGEGGLVRVRFLHRHFLC